jgi:competence protein ComEC
MNNTIVSFAIFAVLGIIAGKKLPYSPDKIFIIALFIWVSTVYSWRRAKKITHVLILILITLLGGLRYQLSDPARTPDSLFQFVDKGRYNLELVVVSPVKRSYSNYDFQCEVTSIEGDKVLNNPRGTVFVTIHGNPAGGIPAYGSKLRASAIINGHKDRYSSPWVNGKDFLLDKGIVGTISLQQFSIQVDGNSPPSHLRLYLFRLRKMFEKLLINTHEERTATILDALLFGEKSNLSPAVWEDFQRSGTIHLLAQSGLHTGILAIVVFVTASSLRIGKLPTTVFTIIVLLLYAIMVGENSSVLRATLMISIILIGQCLKKTGNPFTSLGFAAIILLLADPSSLFLPGFQLSFIATTGILYLSPTFANIFSFLPSVVTSLLSVSLSSFLATAPLILYYFGSVSLAAPVANLFVLPLVAIIIPSALFAMTGGLISPWIAYFFGAANYGFVTLLLLVNSVFGSGLFPTFSTASFPLPFLYGWYVLLIAAGDQKLVSRIINGTENDQSSVTEQLLTGNKLTPHLIDENLFQDILNTEKELNPLKNIFFAEKSLIFQNQQVLRIAATDGQVNLQKCLGSKLLSVTKEVAELLLFSECWHLATPTHEFRPPMAALLLAVETELNRRFFAPIARNINFRENIPNKKELNLLKGQQELTLRDQLELLWQIATPDNDDTVPELSQIREWIKATTESPATFLDATRLPLLLDQFVKRYYIQTINNEKISLGNFFEAREDSFAKGMTSIIGLINNNLRVEEDRGRKKR